MHRKPPQQNAMLESLIDERDHLKIQMSLAAERGQTATVCELRMALDAIEKRISSHRRSF